MVSDIFRPRSPGPRLPLQHPPEPLGLHRTTPPDRGTPPPDHRVWCEVTPGGEESRHREEEQSRHREEEQSRHREEEESRHLGGRAGTGRKRRAGTGRKRRAGTGSRDVAPESYSRSFPLGLHIPRNLHTYTRTPHPGHDEGHCRLLPCPDRGLLVGMVPL
ncbi:unnamed protein product [Pleuronectes platessa]|uniref:Uncharacterized protein n=1 Tax=Pleuronectes platessa TaxID=8262 RepID=A0A9N7U5B6_PLEPL|nr:unnamed protein product [Pleuronectes platessa]